MFKKDFKYYKSRNPPPDLCNILNFNEKNTIEDKVHHIGVEPQDLDFFGIKPIQHWEVYEIIDNPGLIFIRNPFTTLGQRYWTVRCVRDYTRKPNKLNLDIHGIIPENRDWWEMCQSTENKCMVNKLRWATLGYHHNWDTKVYSEESRDDFPSDLALLTKYVASALGYKDFTAEAAIVNYYHMDSTLSGHTDHSEQFLEAPLFSFSFGQSAIFLLGGTTIDTKPTAMFLHSGDIVVMSKESRLCYHGVPKVIRAPKVPWKDIDLDEHNCNDVNGMLVLDCLNENFWTPFEEYLENSRININVRQVLQSEQQNLYTTFNNFKST